MSYAYTLRFLLVNDYSLFFFWQATIFSLIFHQAAFSWFEMSFSTLNWNTLQKKTHCFAIEKQKIFPGPSPPDPPSLQTPHQHPGQLRHWSSRKPIAKRKANETSPVRLLQCSRSEEKWPASRTCTHHACRVEQWTPAERHTKDFPGLARSREKAVMAARPRL